MESSGRDIMGYLRLIHKKKELFIISTIAIITVAVIGGYFLPAAYEAKCSVLIETNVIEKLIKDIAVTPSMDERLRVISHSMRSRNLLLKVIKDLGADRDVKSHADMEEIVLRLQKNTKVKSTRKMDMFTVFYRGRDPEFARDYVNTLVRMYIEQNISEKREEAYGANRFLSEQIKFFKEKLDRAELEIVNFRKERGIFVAIDERRVVEEIKVAQEKLDELQLRKEELMAKKGMIKKQMKEEDPYTVAILGMRPGETLQGRLFMLQGRVRRLLNKYTENHPEVLSLMAEIETLKSQARQGKPAEEPEEAGGAETEMATLNPLYQQFREESAKVDLEMAVLVAKEGHIRRLIESKKEYLRDIPEEKKNLMDLERNRDAYGDIYGELVRKLGQSEVSKQMEVQDKTGTFRIVDPAVLPVKPVSPNRLKLLLMGIFGGLVGGLLIVLALDYMDKSVKTLEAVRSLGLPVLVVIPSIRNPEEMQRTKRRDNLLYGLAGAYGLCIVGIVTLEVLR